MIAVIADDFTGAAEIGGFGLKHGLSTEIVTDIAACSDVELVVVSTDTRSQSEEQAVAITKKVISDLMLLKPDLVYKKTDSVLRGHVLQEIRTQLEVSGLKRAILVPANPVLNRKVENGHYYINNIPAHLTSFAHDPEFPVQSSRIEDMLRCAAADIHVLPHTASLPEHGVIVGEATTAEDLLPWCTHANKDTILAGASAFFDVLLNHCLSFPSFRRNPEVYEASQVSYTSGFLLNDVGEDEKPPPALLICGSTTNESRSFIRDLALKGAPVSFISKDFLLPKKIISDLKQHQKAILAIDPEISTDATALRSQTARFVKQIMAQVTVNELLIEGGSTAAAILQELNITALHPVGLLAPGVIRMKVKGKNDLHITSKPGSYAWPPDII